MTDAEIIELFWQRKEAAIHETEVTYGGKLRRLAEKILCCRQDAEECVSDTYLKAWQAMPPARPQYLYAYLAKICRFGALDRLDWQHAQKRHAQVVELSAELTACIPDNALEKAATGEEIGQMLTQFIRLLSEEKRQLFLHRYWIGESIAEIAAATGLRQSSVKTSLHRIRKALRIYLEKEGISI